MVMPWTAPAVGWWLQWRSEPKRRVADSSRRASVADRVPFPEPVAALAAVDHESVRPRFAQLAAGAACAGVQSADLASPCAAPKLAQQLGLREDALGFGGEQGHQIELSLGQRRLGAVDIDATAGGVDRQRADRDRRSWKPSVVILNGAAGYPRKRRTSSDCSAFNGFDARGASWMWVSPRCLKPATHRRVQDRAIMHTGQNEVGLPAALHPSQPLTTPAARIRRGL